MYTRINLLTFYFQVSKGNVTDLQIVDLIHGRRHNFNISVTTLMSETKVSLRCKLSDVIWITLKKVQVETWYL